MKNDLIGFSNETAMTLQISQLKALSTYITSKIAENKNEMDSLLEEREQVLWEIGNLVHSSVPVSDDEENNIVERIYLPEKGIVTDSGEIDSMKKSMEHLFTDKPLNHVDLVLMVDGVDLERGAVVAGSRGYFMKGELLFNYQTPMFMGAKLCFIFDIFCGITR